MHVQTYNPVLTWANQQFDVKFLVSDSIFGAAQQRETHVAIMRYLEGRQLIPLCSCTSAISMWLISCPRLCKCFGKSPALTDIQMLAITANVHKLQQGVCVCRIGPMAFCSNGKPGWLLQICGPCAGSHACKLVHLLCHTSGDVSPVVAGVLVRGLDLA